MNKLLEHVQGYLESAGFTILEQQDEFLAADRIVFGQERSTWIVWTVPPGTDAESYQPKLRASISQMRPSYPDAMAFVLARSRGGFKREFLQTLTELRIKFLVPSWFFDTALKVEETPRIKSAIADIRSLDILRARVPQPFEQYTDIGTPTDGSDLFDHLIEDLSGAQDPTIRIVVGRAGIGKSFLFRALFARLYNDFIEAKNRQAAGRRPIPLLPEHLKDSYAIRTELLIDNFLRKDVASSVARESFEWLLVNGYTSWFLDGLDELYAGDPYFFEYLADLVTRKNSKAQITILCRDSLLTTSDNFAEFRDFCGGSRILKLYQLSEWQGPSKRLFAWLKIENKHPRQGAQDTPRVASFLQEINSSPTLRALSGLPFYCELLLQQYRDGRLPHHTDDVSMLDFVIDEMIKREEEKGVLDIRLFEPNGLQDWLEQIAVKYVEGGRYADIDRDEAMEYGRLVLRDMVDEQMQNHMLTSLVQFPLFRAGEASGLIGFAHDLIAEALAARAYVRRLPRQVVDVAYQISRVDLEDPTLLRFMAMRLDSAGEGAITEALRRGSLREREYTALLTLLLLARPERDLPKRVLEDFEAKYLVGVRFEKRDLSGSSFRRADLSHVLFRGCNLQGARFEGAYLNRTRFEGENHIEDAQFGDLARVRSIMVGHRLFEDPDQIKKWIAKETGRPESHGEPCPTALQLAHAFGKFITPLGAPRRDDLRTDGLTAGRRYPSAASPLECVEEATRNGYLTGPDHRDRYRRAEGDKYAEMVKFVRDGSVSDALGRVVSRLCRIRGCTHQLKT